MKKEMKLQTKITLLVVSVVFISISIIIAYSIIQTTKNIEEEIRTNILNVAKMTANYTDIQKELERRDPNHRIAQDVTALLDSVEKIEYIVVADMNGIRYSHPNPQRIGELFVGGDEIEVLSNGLTYVSEAEGTLGKSLRAFTPVYSIVSGKQIGFVSVGTLSQNIGLRKRSAIVLLVVVALSSLGIGTECAILLARSIKNTLMGLEPHEISRLYDEKMAMLDTLYEGIVAVDENGKITLINDSALRIINTDTVHTKNEIIGVNIEEIIPTSSLNAVMESKTAEYDREQRIKDTIVLTNRVPMVSRGHVIGAIASFREKNEITKLAEELTGVKQIVDALRANSHEFLNKLHVILGLIHMGDLEEAQKYITTITSSQQRILGIVTGKIKDPSVAGLVLGKISRSSELGINLKIDEKTWLSKNHEGINSNTLVTIVGNLVENAMAAVMKNSGEKFVFIKIVETSTAVEIAVEDNGIGIDTEGVGKIFQRGYTTKEESKGMGLALLKESVDSLEGSVKIESIVGKGSCFTVELPCRSF